MKNKLNYYQLLHVQPDAPTEIIRASYRTLMLKLKKHPDMGGDESNAALINMAYATLSNARKRAEYDRIPAGCHAVGVCRASSAQAPQEAKRKIGYAKHQDPNLVPTSCCLFCKTSHRGDLHMKTDQVCSCCGSPLHPVMNSVCLSDRQRRTVRRMAQHRGITFYTAWPQPGFPGYICDLSPMGMRIRAEERLDKEQLIKIESDVLDATAMVVYCRGNFNCEPECYVIGIKFHTLLFQRSLGTFLSITA